MQGERFKLRPVKDRAQFVSKRVATEKPKSKKK